MSRPNILLLFSDEHSFRFMGHIPKEEGGEPAITPTFDGLAAQGTVFSNAYCAMPLCTPSRLCLLTGLDVRDCGAWENECVLRPELQTLPATLQESGYETCLVGKMHLGGTQQFVGFQHRPYGDLTGWTGHQWEPMRSPNGHEAMRSRTADAGLTGIPESLLQDVVVTQETLAWLREHQSAQPNKPWFLCASFSRPHFPYTTPQRWLDRYPVDEVTPPRVPASGDAYDHPMSVGMRKGFLADEIDEAETKRARSAYFACVSYLDEIVGDMLMRLERSGLLENTIIIYTSDHGEMAGEHGVWYKNGWYEGCTRVPLIVSTPEQRRGAQEAAHIETPVSLIDLYPTMTEMAEAHAPAVLQGVSLASAVTDGQEPPERPIFCDVLKPRWGAGTEFRSIRWRHWKYVVFRDAAPLFFDLVVDPGEQVNLLNHELDDAQTEALSYLTQVADESIDFDGAEQDRLVRDGDLSETYRQNVPLYKGNFYILPSGQLVTADDIVYRPNAIVDNLSDAFGNDWTRQNVGNG